MRMFGLENGAHEDLSMREFVSVLADAVGLAATTSGLTEKTDVLFGHMVCGHGVYSGFDLHEV